MGAETEAHVWCDGPRAGEGCVNGGNNEYGPTIGAVRAFLKNLGWVVRKRDGETVDICTECKEG